MYSCVFARGSGHQHADSERAMFHANEENARVFFFFLRVMLPEYAVKCDPAGKFCSSLRLKKGC